MAIIGFIFVCVIALAATVTPFLLIAISGLGGGMRKWDWLFLLFVWCFSGFCWWYAYNNSPFTITMN